MIFILGFGSGILSSEVSDSDILFDISLIDLSYIELDYSMGIYIPSVV